MDRPFSPSRDRGERRRHGPTRRQQHQHAHIADQRHADIAHQAGLLALFLAGTDRQQEEGHAEHIAQHHHGQIQPIVVAHHAAVQHAQHRGVGCDGQRQLAACAGHHQTLHGVVFPDDLDILTQLDLFRLGAADTEVFGAVLLPDAHDGQDGQDEQRGQTSQKQNRKGAGPAGCLLQGWGWVTGCPHWHRRQRSGPGLHPSGCSRNSPGKRPWCPARYRSRQKFPAESVGPASASSTESPRPGRPAVDTHGGLIDAVIEYGGYLAPVLSIQPVLYLDRPGCKRESKLLIRMISGVNGQDLLHGDAGQIGGHIVCTCQLQIIEK